MVMANSTLLKVKSEGMIGVAIATGLAVGIGVLVGMLRRR